MSRYKVTAPNTEYSGTVGELQFSKGVFEGEVSDAALRYFETAGYGLGQLDGTDAADTEHSATDEGDDPDGPGGLPAKSAVRPEWEQAARDLEISDEDIAAASNKDQLIELVTAAHAAKASTTNGDQL